MRLCESRKCLRFVEVLAAVDPMTASRRFIASRVDCLSPRPSVLWSSSELSMSALLDTLCNATTGCKTSWLRIAPDADTDLLFDRVSLLDGVALDTDVSRRGRPTVLVAALNTSSTMTAFLSGTFFLAAGILTEIVDEM